MNNDWVYDTEEYPNVFTIAFEHVDAPIRLCFEISNYRDDSALIFEFLQYLRDTFARLVGFNNVGFDYPVLHLLMKMGRGDAPTLYNKAMAIIGSQDKQDRWAHGVKPTDRYIPQIDLFLIHHFDNGARATSLKALEFNMRSMTIEDLPFPVGTVLNPDQIVTLKQYNAHDVAQTKKFYHHTKGMIAFRDELSEKYHRDFVNHNDTKIGKDYFVMQLEAAGVACYTYGKAGRQPKQTPRAGIQLADAILPWIQFEQPEFARVLAWLREQTILTTKGAFKDIKATIDGLPYIFGTGGIHASRSCEIVEADNEHMILDLDVTSFYPNLAIKNGFFPEHLGAEFVTIYEALFKQRGTYPKKSSESQMLKLALNGVYGDSGNPFSVFYDPLFTMKITMNGQLLLCMLAENLMKVPGLRVLQCNTDGITVKLPRCNESVLRQVCKWWEGLTNLTLEDVEYTRINMRDVNNFVAVSTKGSVKRKGAYEWQAGSLYDSGYNGWNQDASFLVVPKVAEKVLTEGVSIRDTVTNWPDVMDFMIRIKVPRSGYLEWGDPVYVEELNEEGKLVTVREMQPSNFIQNTSRYLVTTDGQQLTKWLPPIKKKEVTGTSGDSPILGGDRWNGLPGEVEQPALVDAPKKWRSFQQESGWKVTIANRLTGSEQFNIDYDYYIQECEKLIMCLK